MKKERIKEQFENFWELYSRKKGFKEKDKSKYYQLFLDGYSCALINLEEGE